MRGGVLFTTLLAIAASFGLSLLTEGAIAAEGREQATALLRSLCNNPKLHRPDIVLEGFEKGDDAVHVIVTLKALEWTPRPAKFRNASGKREVREVARTIQQAVIDRLPARETTVNNRFSYIPSFAATVTEKGLQQLLEDSDVERVDVDHVLEAHLAQGIPLINATTVRSVYSGAGVAIAVCDTGIDYTHAQLGGGGFPNNKVIGGYDFGGESNDPADEDDDPMDEHGHGTACAGIAAGSSATYGDYIGGVAHDAKLYALKISYGSSGSAHESDMIAAWEWSITHQDDDPDNPIMVISTSFGGGGYDEECDDASSAMTEAAANAVAAGITIFASAGNNGYCDKLAWPACISYVVSVGGVFDANIGGVGFCVNAASCAENMQDYSSCSTGKIAWSYSTTADQVAPYSNTAGFLDIFAPSNNTYTTRLGGGYNSAFGGTSAACPYAAGAAAIMQSAVKAATGAFASSEEVRAELKSYGDSITYASAGITKPRINVGAMDMDGDGMPAEWETEMFGDMSRDGSGDIDLDGLTDLEEYQYGTDPNAADTDSDGFADGVEVQAETSPLDNASYPTDVPAATGWELGFLFLALLTMGIIGGKQAKGVS